MPKHLTHSTPNDEGRNTIDYLVIDYDVPQRIANLLVGKTEEETAENIADFKGYLKYLIDTHKEFIRERGVV